MQTEVLNAEGTGNSTGCGYGCCLVWPDFLKRISLEQGSEGGDMAWIARGERILVQVCGWVGGWGLELSGQLWKPYTPGFWVDSYCGFLRNATRMKFERLHWGFWAYEIRKGKKQGRHYHPYETSGIYMSSVENIINIPRKGVSELDLFTHVTCAKYLLCSGRDLRVDLFHELGNRRPDKGWDLPSATQPIWLADSWFLFQISFYYS